MCSEGCGYVGFVVYDCEAMKKTGKSCLPEHRAWKGERECVCVCVHVCVCVWRGGVEGGRWGYEGGGTGEGGGVCQETHN